MTKAQIGGSEWNNETVRIRNAANTIRDALSRILEGNPGPQTIAQLVAKMAVQIGIIIDAVANIERIGRDAKNDRTR